MLAISDPWGHIRASIPGLADLARVSIADAKDAVERLEAPDEYSRTKDHEGRRIEELINSALRGSSDMRRSLVAWSMTKALFNPVRMPR